MFKIPWNLSDLESVSKNGRKVFSCFHCGGGSTMGYKLAGYEVLGGVEIDPEMMAVYRANHAPKHSYLMGVQEFNKIPRDQIPTELFDLDILDGSPPCSFFSMAGSREKKWGVKTHFREGQTEQILDDLFFHFIETARILQPKIVIAENVKGLVIGKAKGYVKQINEMFQLAGYEMQLFLLNAAFLGVPQARERTFFIGRKKNLNLSSVSISAKNKPINLADVLGESAQKGTQVFSEKRFGDSLLKMKRPLPTLTPSGRYFVNHKNQLDNQTLIKCQTFPEDFNFNKMDPKYIMGMSVPPVMMANISSQIFEQVFKS